MNFEKTASNLEQFFGGYFNHNYDLIVEGFEWNYAFEDNFT